MKQNISCTEGKARKPLTAAEVRRLIKGDDKFRLKQERKAFMAWWMTYDDRDEGSLKAAWNAWKRRAGFKA